MNGSARPAYKHYLLYPSPFELTDRLETRQQTLVLHLSNCCCAFHIVVSCVRLNSMARNSLVAVSTPIPALDMADCLLRQHSIPAASTLLTRFLTQHARRRFSVSILLHLLSTRKCTSHHLKQCSPPSPWYGLVFQPFAYFFST
jgi:hypothetical protein